MHVQISSRLVLKEIVPYAAFEQVIESRNMEKKISERIWTKFGWGPLQIVLRQPLA